MKKLTEDDIVIKERIRKYDGFYKIDEVTFDHHTMKGGIYHDVRREVFVRNDAVGVLPYDPVEDKVLLVRQLRIPALGKCDNPWLIELIAGLVDQEDETYLEVAKREAFEEAGIKISNLVPICDYFSSVGGSNEKMYIFLSICDLRNSDGLFGLVEEKEDIEVFCVPRAEALDMVASGEIQTAVAIIGLQWLALNYHKYRSK